MEGAVSDEAFICSSESESSDANYSNTSITLSEMSIDSDKVYSDGEKNTSDKGVQTDDMKTVGHMSDNNDDTNVRSVTSRYQPTCVNINLTYQDRVSLWVQGGGSGSGDESDKDYSLQEHHQDKNSMVIVSREKVTLRINPGRIERRLSDSTLYEDIEEASEWMSKEYLQSLRPKTIKNQHSPPPLPPRLFAPPSSAGTVSTGAGEKLIKRKNLNHLLGIDDQMNLNILKDNHANINAIKNLQEIGRVKSKKDLTKFLGIHDAKLRKRPRGKKYSDHRRSKSIIENIMNATKHFKYTKDQNYEESFTGEALNHSERFEDQGRWEKINPEDDTDKAKIDVTRIEEFDNLPTSLKIVTGNENEDADASNRDLLYNKSRTSSFSSVSSSRTSSSSQESLLEKSSLIKVFRHSSRRFSTSGIELMESLRRKSTFNKKYQSSLEDIPLDSSFVTDDNIYKDKSCIEEFLAKGMPVIPFDQPLMALMETKQDPHCTFNTKSIRRKPKYFEEKLSVGDSLDALIKLAQGELKQESYKSHTSSSSSSSAPKTSWQDEPIYIEMSKGSSSLSSRPNCSEYMDMDIVQAAIESCKL